jgi:hypothetical protein
MERANTTAGTAAAVHSSILLFALPAHRSGLLGMGKRRGDQLGTQLVKRNKSSVNVVEAVSKSLSSGQWDEALKALEVWGLASADEAVKSMQPYG